MFYQVRDVAGLSGVSVRTLHHYDAIGLLKPSSVSPAGYRLYSQADLRQLQQILFYKELDFNLSEIKRLLSVQASGKNRLLQAQYQLLLKKKSRLEKIIRTLEQTLRPKKGDKKMSDQAMFQAFDNSDLELHKKHYAREARERYGHTDAYRESQARTKHYTKADWKRIMHQGNAIYQVIAAQMDKAPGDASVQALVRQWQDYISQNFYACTPEILGGLGQLYVNDARFMKNIDKIKPGLAIFLSRAIALYCKKHS